MIAFIAIFALYTTAGILLRNKYFDDFLVRDNSSHYDGKPCSMKWYEQSRLWFIWLWPVFVVYTCWNKYKENNRPARLKRYEDFKKKFEEYQKTHGEPK